VLNRTVDGSPIVSKKASESQHLEAFDYTPNRNVVTNGAKDRSLAKSDTGLPAESPHGYAEMTKPQDQPNISSAAKTISRNDIIPASTPFSPSNVKKLSKSRKKRDSPAPRVLSRLLGSVYNSIAPAVVNSSYSIGSTVATTIVPAVASSSYVIGSAVTSKIGETIVGNSSLEFRKANEMKFELLDELSKAKAALDVQDIDKAELKHKMEALFRENLSLHAEFEQRAQSARIQQVSAKHVEIRFAAQTVV
jgi:hypothetical protein